MDTTRIEARPIDPARPGGRFRTRILAGIGVVASTAAIALADLLTGDEIRIFPLYFLPLTLVAWYFGRTVAIVASLLLTLVWLEVIHMGRTDELTGLPNRRSFMEEGRGVVSLCRRHGWPATLAYVDLDNFKLANDRLGHEHGDAVLRRVAEVITTSLRRSDLTGRIGGDEFVVLLPETTPEGARETLEKVRRAMRSRPSPFTTDLEPLVEITAARSTLG